MFRGAGLAVIHTDIHNNHSVLLGKSNKYNSWNFPGGGREKDEEPSQTAYREFIEEVFNVNITNTIVNEIIDLITKNTKCLPLNTLISNNQDVPSYTFVQKDECITIMVNILSKHDIFSTVFNVSKFKKSNNFYENLFDFHKHVNIHHFCSMRRYITEKPKNSMNELVFITMIPLKNILHTISQNEKYHYHFEYLRLAMPTMFIKINDILNTNTILDPELLHLEQLVIV